MTYEVAELTREKNSYKKLHEIFSEFFDVFVFHIFFWLFYQKKLVEKYLRNFLL